MAEQVQQFSFQSAPEETVEQIRKEKELVLDIRISEWLSDMQHTWQETGFDSEQASSWMVLLAILLEWKMQLLLPKPVVEVEEEVYDREAHLDEYRLIQKTAQKLSELALERSFWLPRESDDRAMGVEPQDRLRNTKLFDLLKAFQRVLESEEVVDEADEIISAEEYDIENQMTYLMTRVEQFEGKILFRQLFRAGSSRSLLIVTFLALLELVRKQQLQIEQATPYGELWIGVIADGARETLESDDSTEPTPE